MSEPVIPDVTSAFRDADYLEVPEELHVYSWSPGPPGTVAKPTQVHLHAGKAPGPIWVMRFKSPRTLDLIIKALIEHRIDVWGQP